MKAKELQFDKVYSYNGNGTSFIFLATRADESHVYGYYYMFDRMSKGSLINNNNDDVTNYVKDPGYGEEAKFLADLASYDKEYTPKKRGLANFPIY